MAGSSGSSVARARSRAELATFMYHDVADQPRESGFQRRAAQAYKHSRRDFFRHLELFAAAPAQPELIVDIDLTRPGRHLLLTFDDGGKSAVYVGDELCKRGWRGHFFVTTGYIGRASFVDRSVLRYLRSCGHLIGSHSHTHPGIFRALSSEAMLAEWRRSTDVLSDILGERVIAASVPGGELSKTVHRSAVEAGFSYLFTSEPELVPSLYGTCWLIGRVAPKAGILPARVEAWSHFQGWTRELADRRMKGAIKRIAGPLYRLYVGKTGQEPLSAS